MSWTTAGHRNLVTRPDLIGEMLDWFEKYLGTHVE